MKRDEILSTANEYVTKDRAASHGDMEDNFSAIAKLWSAYTGSDITSIDVGVMMNLLKCARIRSNHSHMDNYVDGAGYMACAGEIASRGQTT